jgi:hypothetical protein
VRGSSFSIRLDEALTAEPLGRVFRTRRLRSWAGSTRWRPYSHHQSGEEVEAEIAAGSPGESERVDREISQGTFEAGRSRPPRNGRMPARTEAEGAG